MSAPSPPQTRAPAGPRNRDRARVRYDARNWKPVPNPKFEVITPGTEWGVNGHDQRIKNSQIKKAIARDVDYWNVP